MAETCKNHPDREGKRKCYYCKAAICSECQLTIAHHIYCSRSCFYKNIAINVKNFFLNLFEKAKIFIVSTYKDLRSKPANLIIALALIVGLIFSIYLNFSNVSKLHKLQKELAALETQVSLSDSAASAELIAKKLDTLKIEPVSLPAMVIRNTITIEGETDDNQVVTLSVDGDILAVQLVKNNKFKFEKIRINPGQNRFVVRAISEDGNSVLLEEIKFKYAPPTPSYLARDFTRGSIREKLIALTFDGDYLDNVTAEILDALKQEHIHATMFLTGRYIRRYSQQVIRMLEEGHEIGNHTWTHPHLTTFEQNRKHETRPGVTRELVQQELLKTAELFRQLTGRKMSPYWRAPFGEHNAEIRQWAAEIGFRQIGWTVGKDWQNNMDTLDWVADTSATIYHTAEEIIDKILSFEENTSHGANGCIILMHLGTLRQGDYPHQKLPDLIRELKQRGYKFVTISELIAS